mgnify:FL=1
MTRPPGRARRHSSTVRMRAPIGAFALTAGVSAGFTALSLAADRACAVHDCSTSHPTISMTLRDANVRRDAVPLLTASAACLLVADVALWAVATSDHRRGGAGGVSTHAALLAGVASFPALLTCVESDPRGGTHLDAAAAWSALRMVQGALALPGVVMLTKGSGGVKFAMLNVARAVAVFALLGIGAKLCADAPSGDMSGGTQFAAARGILAYHLSLLPEISGVRLVLCGTERARIDCDARYIPGNALR